MRKYADSSCNYEGVNTKGDTHCFRGYPAMMIPQVAGRLLNLYAPSAWLLFDPYCGTGTSLVEANLRGINAVGTDLNPLARLIATAKTTPIEAQVLDRALQDCRDYLFGLQFGGSARRLMAPEAENLATGSSPRRPKRSPTRGRSQTGSMRHRRAAPGSSRFGATMGSRPT